MEKKISRFKVLMFFLAFGITILLVVTGAYVQEGYVIEVGEVSPQRFVAPRKIENTVATEKNRLAAVEAAEKIEPLLERDTTVTDKVYDDLSNFFDKATIRRKEFTLNDMHSTLIQETAVPSSPVINENPVPKSAITNTDNLIPEDSITQLPIHLSESLTNTLMEMDEPTYKNFMEEVFAVTDQIFEDGLQAKDAKGLLNVRDHIEELDLKADYKNLCYEIVAAYIKPNIIINVEATNKAKKERSEKFETVHYKQDQIIVDKSDIISTEAYAALEQLSLIKKDSANNIYLIIGSFALVGSVFVMFFLYARLFLKKVISTVKDTLLFFTLYLSTILICYLTINVPYQLSTNLIFIMLIAMLFDSRMSIVTNMLITIVCMLISNGNLEFVLYYLFTGTFIAFVSQFTVERNKIVIAGSLTCVVCLLSYLGVSLFFEKTYSPDILSGAVFAGGMGLISVIVSIGSAPFWEAVFGIITPYRLVDLANPNSPILRRLTIEAPGTYHHSLIVANLAENASYEIGANPALARTGGYYHDIGKLKFPQYFGENQAGVNPHETMEPLSSVAVIVEHVTFGMELAEKYRIPKVIQDFIFQHHGTTLVKYFYIKAKNELELQLKEGESLPEGAMNEHDFRYHNIIPQSKETAVVMLADTVEAAVRSVVPSGKSMDEVEKLMRKLVKEKVDDGQLLDSGMTLKDIEKTINAFLIVFKGMYHGRIPYPEDKSKGAKEDAKSKPPLEKSQSGEGEKETKGEKEIK